MRDAQAIVSLYQDRKKKWGPVHAAAQLLRTVYNGELDVVLPELESSERVAVTNLIQSGIDQHAMRIASTTPNIVCPPLSASQAAKTRANDRRMAFQAWWYVNNIARLDRRRARHLVGYAMAPVMIRPCADGYPKWQILDPLTSFPAPTDPDDLNPPDHIACMKHSLRWLELNYPDAVIRLSRGPEADGDTMFEVLHYVDSEQISLVAVGQEDGFGDTYHATLSTTSNRAMRPLVVVPGRITLDKLQGQFDQMIGMYQTQAKLWALQLQAIERSVFAETYAISKDNDVTPEVVPADPYTGDIGTVAGGIIQQFRTDPNLQNLTALDRLEAAQRSTGAVPAEFGGEAASNVRTGRRGTQILSSTVDFFIQEHQELLAASHQVENDCAVDVALGWFATKSRTFVIPMARKPVKFAPIEVFDPAVEGSRAQFVQYPYAGSDTNGLVIEMGQRIGMGTLSKETGMAMDPMIADVDAEMDRIVLEGIRAANLNSLQQQAADPNGPYQPVDLARLEQLVYERNMPLYQAEQKLHEEIQQRQLQAQQGQLNDQQMQPGLSVPGAPGTPQAAQAIGPAPPSMSNLTGILANLRLQQRQSPAELASPGG